MNPSNPNISSTVLLPSKSGTEYVFQSAAAYCDISGSSAFIEDPCSLHVPILCAFGGERLHTCRLFGSWDLDKMATDHPDALYRSIIRLPVKNTRKDIRSWDDLTFQFGPRTFVYADENRIVSFTSDPKEAEDIVGKFAEKYQRPVPQTTEGGIFYLIQQERDRVETKKVSLTAETILKPEVFDLHYGGGHATWHQEYLKKLDSRTSGLSIFEGKPGTGKTSYVRHLMGELKESHRFYFIPSSGLSILTRPDFIGFWAEQRQRHEDKKFAVVLEDSDSMLMTRGSDNRESVSALLNLSDGMLADFLRLQIICTINCSTTDIDPALLRPGRLVCHRVFNRLDYNQAAQLATHLGKDLPRGQDYSLAEVFAGSPAIAPKHQRIGFAACAIQP